MTYRIVLDDKKWPAEKREHIRVQKDKRGRDVIVPDAFWAALPLIDKRRPRVGLYEAWWIDLSEYHPTLRGWKLAGHGEQPDTVLMPGEKPEGTKLLRSSAFDGLFLAEIEE